MDFGKDHNDAMAVRLQKYHFKTLNKERVAGVQGFLKTHAMDCIVWASQLAKTPEDEVPFQVAAAQSTDKMDASEKRRIRALNVDSDSDIVPEQGEETENETDDESQVAEPEIVPISEEWDRSLRRISELRDQQPRGSLKLRQLELIGGKLKRVVDEAGRLYDDRENAFLEETKARWVELGMIRQEQAHLVTSLSEPFHPDIEESRREKKQEDEEEELRRKAAKYYDNEWLVEREAELREVQKQEDVCIDIDVKKAFQYRIQVSVDALRLHFQKEELPGLKKYVLAERKERSVKLKWITREQANTVTSIWNPLPFPGLAGSSDEDEDELSRTQELFTPRPTSSQNTQARDFLIDHQPRRKRASRRGSSAASVPKKGRITNYFSSQK